MCSHTSASQLWSFNSHCHTCLTRSLLPPPPQGLKAFLLSSPYDCPPWAPEVLMALVPAAGGGRQPAAVRSEAAQALSEFKRTHEQVWLAVRSRTTCCSHSAMYASKLSPPSPQTRILWPPSTHPHIHTPSAAWCANAAPTRSPSLPSTPCRPLCLPCPETGVHAFVHTC